MLLIYIKDSFMKYNVYGIMTASVFLGEYEAEDSEAAIELAEKDKQADWNPCLCHQCAGDIELGEVNDVQAVECIVE